MVDPLKIEHVKLLLRSPDRPFTQREISRVTGVSRGVIARVVAGKRPDYHLRPIAAAEPPRPTRKCPTCGAKTELPCRACEIRRQLATLGLHVRRNGPDPEGPLALELRPADRARYEKVRARKQQEERLDESVRDDEPAGPEFGDVDDADLAALLAE